MSVRAVNGRQPRRLQTAPLAGTLNASSRFSSRLRVICKRASGVAAVWKRCKRCRGDFFILGGQLVYVAELGERSRLRMEKAMRGCE